MGQWLQKRKHYLDLLLENKGITHSPICSMCGKAMELKCSDCIGATYFCTPCFIQSHKRTPFHWLSHWTGHHLTPVTLDSLGFILFLGHHGEPCPYTVEVCVCPLLL
jgi:hypothetical protein